MSKSKSSSKNRSKSSLDPQKTVGISISDSPDLEAFGYGEEHLHELMVTVARTVLRIEAGETGLVYGGDLRPGGFSRSLFDLALGESAGRRRLYNYLAWPYYLTLAKHTEAEMINACYFVRVSPQDAGFTDVSARCKPKDLDQGQKALVGARCLTRMRELQCDGGSDLLEDGPAPPMTARIIIGGKVTGYSSFMPGIFEEFLVSRERGVPVYLMGGLGGAAGALAEAILRPPAQLTEISVLQLAWQAEQDAARFKVLTDVYMVSDQALPTIEQRYEQLHEQLRRLGQDLERFDNGLSADENRELLTTEDGNVVRRLLRKGLEKICA